MRATRGAVLAGVFSVAAAGPVAAQDGPYAAVGFGAGVLTEGDGSQVGARFQSYSSVGDSQGDANVESFDALVRLIIGR